MPGHNPFSAYGGSQRRYRSALDDAAFQRLVGEAKARHNLSDIVGRHTTLKKRGARELVGICCFHQERSPSLEVNDNKGTYHCHGCGAGGDAITFLMRQEGMTFREAIETLTGDVFPTISEEDRARRKQADAEDIARRIALARSIWSSSIPLRATAGEVYLLSRGLDPARLDMPTVRYVEAPRWRNEETGEVGRNHPAVACGLQDVTGAIVGVQCIFLQKGGTQKYQRQRDDGTMAKAKLTFGIIVGSALRLGPPSDTIVICEGPEDGMTLFQELGRTIWVACGTALMSRINIPSSVSTIILAGDNGDAGRAAVDAATEAYTGIGLRVGTRFPRSDFKDWNDQLRGVTL